MNTQKTQDKHAHIKLSGRFTYNEHESFQNSLEALLERELTEVTIDLSSLKFIDSAGLGMLLLMRDKIPAHTHISLSGAQEQVRKILTLTHLDQVFTLH